jgi:CBS domain-containing protein
VEEIMTTDVLTVSGKDSVADCLEIMTKNHVRHLPVMDGDRLTGLVSIGDLVNWIILAQSNAIEDLQRFVTGAYPG